MSLLKNNTIRLEVGKKYSKPITINCSVPQGGPLSPQLFNIAINYIYNEVCDKQFSNLHGYQIEPDLDALCLTGFADDQAVTSNSKESAIRIINLTKSLFEKIGLSINPAKSSAINIVKGELEPSDLYIDGSKIECIQKTDRIKYLGCTFTNQIVFNTNTLESFEKNFEKLVASSLLKPDQKLKIINQYIFPMLTYPLQSAPLNKIYDYITNGLDIIIRRNVKAIIGLPASTCNMMLYSPRKFRGLAILNCKWEAYLQHFAIAKKLVEVVNPILHKVFDCEEEMRLCQEKLKVNESTSTKMRQLLRESAFNEWCTLKYQGFGAIHYATYPPSNNFIINKNSLSSSEWISAIKLTVNYANLAGVPGNTMNNSSNLCRRCGKERETPSHVIGSCSYNSLLIVNRHHKIKHKLTAILKEKGYDCYEEVYAVDQNGSNRYCDIVAFDSRSKRAIIVDPTVRFETNNQDQDKDVDAEKRKIYESCIASLNEKFGLKHGKRDFEVFGLWFGSRGSISAKVLEFFNKFKIDKKILLEISEEILCDSINILHHHIYG